jgi:hypothetical protein
VCIFVMSSNSKASIKIDYYILSFYLLLQRWAILIAIRPNETCRTQKQGFLTLFQSYFYRNIKSFKNFFLGICKKLISGSPFWGFLLLFTALPSLELLLWKSVVSLFSLLISLMFWLWDKAANASVPAGPTVPTWNNVVTWGAI